MDWFIRKGWIDLHPFRIGIFPDVAVLFYGSGQGGKKLRRCKVDLLRLLGINQNDGIAADHYLGYRVDAILFAQVELRIGNRPRRHDDIGMVKTDASTE